MKTHHNFKTALVIPLFLGVSAFFNFTNAQQTIKEVQLVKNDAFKELRSLMYDNFDPAEVSSEAGVYNSMVKFELKEDGKIANVHAKGDCPFVDKELEQTMNSLLYKLNMNQVGKNAGEKIFAMPVQLVLEK